VIPELASFPLRGALDAGLKVTINSDDPAYFGGYVGQNFAAVRDALGLSADQARRFARTSIEASFASDSRKAELLAELDGWNA
jgi:adenosine deaminase